MNKLASHRALLSRLLSQRQVVKHEGVTVAWDPAKYSSGICKTYLAISRILMCNLNSTKFKNREQLFDLIQNKTERGLLTVSNHMSRLDDPMMWSLLTWKNKFNVERLRWSTAAADVCYKKQFHSDAMSWGKIVPLIRGDGVYQKPMDFCAKLLEAKQWVHLFPEGKINVMNENIRLKWGVGRLVTECSIPPLILPIHHIGFENICLNEGFMSYVFRFGKKASVYVGHPLDLTSEIEKMKQLKLTVEEMRIKITDRVKEEMTKTKLNAEQFHRTSHGLGESSSVE